MRERDDSDEITLRRKSRRQGQRMLTIAVLVAAGMGAMVCGGGVLLWFAQIRPAGQLVPFSGPSESRQGEDWTYRELFDHLKARGVVADMGPADGDDVWFVTDKTSVAHAQTLEDENVLATHAVRVSKCATDEEARDLASRSADGRRFAWGRFYFHGDKNLIQRIETALR